MKHNVGQFVLASLQMIVIEKIPSDILLYYTLIVVCQSRLLVRNYKILCYKLHVLHVNRMKFSNRNFWRKMCTVIDLESMKESMIKIILMTLLYIQEHIYWYDMHT